MSSLCTEGNHSTLHLPRIVCLHGGGTKARIFRAQCRRLSLHLQSETRLVFAQAAFPFNAGSDVLSVYGTWGPFRRWLRWQTDHPEAPAELIAREIYQSLADAMRHDDLCGATGPWVAILGFSQGAKVAASLLYRQHVRESLLPGTGTARGGAGGVRFRFGILLAGRVPLVSLDPSLALCPPLPAAAQITDPLLPGQKPVLAGGHVLRVPTIHVHGLRDKGLELHRQLFDECCDPTTRRLVEWDGDHRVPLKTLDVSRVVHEIGELARETGII